MKHIQDNPILSRIEELLKAQTEKGVKKYGTTVQPEQLSTVQWIDHASEEIIDLLVYLQVLREKVQSDSIKAQVFDQVLQILDETFMGFHDERTGLSLVDEIVVKAKHDIK